MALKPELLKRRKRTPVRRAPERTLGQKTSEEKTSNAEIIDLLRDLLKEAKQETLFTLTQSPGPIIAGLGYAGFDFGILAVVEMQLAPGATTTTYLPVAPGFVYIPYTWDFYSSLPWWLTVMLWGDRDLPSPPGLLLIRAPDKYSRTEDIINGTHRFIRFTVTNNHPTDTANFCAIITFDVVTLATWNMIEEVYFKPIVDYIRSKAEEVTGRPWP